ncbi:MAG TPA: hypothetical protein VEF89_27060 [Solirubrobacteraceae bacterium]|nr:hypothetical protein [Solirubrobacteraceae bacterium]
MPDHAVPADGLLEQIGIAFCVRREMLDLLRRHLWGVHAGDPFALVEVLIPAVEAQAHVAHLHGGPTREPAGADRDVILTGLISPQA